MEKEGKKERGKEGRTNLSRVNQCAVILSRLDRRGKREHVAGSSSKD